MGDGGDPTAGPQAGGQEGACAPNSRASPFPLRLLLPPALTASPSLPAPQPSGCTICEEHYVNELYANPASLPAGWTPEP